MVGVKDKAHKLVGEAHGQQLTALHTLISRARNNAGQQRQAAHKAMLSEVKVGFEPLFNIKTSQNSRTPARTPCPHTDSAMWELTFLGWLFC